VNISILSWFKNLFKLKENTTPKYLSGKKEKKKKKP